ncbi:MAG: DUF1285 domain-containing protein [Bradyrhizobiaceae bacterium]|nr:DUF1285 domain-containing protein [Bradyrhizobiaceae bacterium]
MSKVGPRGLESLAAALGTRREPPRVHLWNPPFCGDIDMRIAADGTWHYQGSPIGRPAMVRLFASVLKREDGRYFLVTPVEKLGIRVDDAPFLAVELETAGEGEVRTLVFRTNVDDVVPCDREHPLRFEPEAETGGIKPYLHVRRDLWALVTRQLFLDLVSLGEVHTVNGHDLFGVVSAGEFFPMAPAEAVAQ